MRNVSITWEKQKAQILTGARSAFGRRSRHKRCCDRRDSGTAPITGSVKRSCLEQRSRPLSPTFSPLFPTFSSLWLQWRTDRTHKATIRTPGTTMEVPHNNRSSIVTSLARDMAGTTTLDTTTRTTMGCTIHTAAITLTITTNRTRLTSRGDTLTTPELLGTKTMHIETPRVRRVNRLSRHRRKTRRRTSTMTRWSKLDLEGHSLARELTSISP